MKFGARRADAPARGSSSGKFIKYFQKGDKTLRFLEEMDDWTEFYDHYSQSLRRSYPCTGNRSTCPGCNSDDERERKASLRLLVNALDPETGYVDLWKVPISLEDPMERFVEKFGTITDRHYTVTQYKDSKGVSYGIDREEKDSTPVEDYADKMTDHQDALLEAYNEAWGEDAADEESPVQEPSPRKPKGSKDTEEDEPPFSKRAEEPEDEDVIDEEDLYDMDAQQLKDLFKSSGLTVPRTSDPEVLRERLLEELGT